MLEFFLQISQQWAYIGVFAATLIGAAVFILPTPVFVLVFILAAPQFGFDPFLLGIAGGLGASIGEMSSWLIGHAGKKVFLKKYKKKLAEIEASFHKYHPFVIIFVFSASPLPIDIVGAFCGVVGYSWKKVYPPMLLGKLVKYWFIAYAGYYSIGWVRQMVGA